MLEGGIDQAAGLRRLLAPRSVQLLPVALAAEQDARWIVPLTRGLREAGREPVVVDAARGRASAAFGLRPRRDLLDLLQGRDTFDRVAQRTREGVHVLCGDAGIEAFAGAGGATRQLLAGFGGLSHGFSDLLLVMPGAEIACVAPPDEHVPALAIDAGRQGMVAGYGLLKQLAASFGYRRFACVVTGAANRTAALAAHERIAGAAAHFLGVDAAWVGWIAPAADPHAMREAAATAHALLRLAEPHPTPLPA